MKLMKRIEQKMRKIKEGRMSENKNGQNSND